MTVFPIRSGSFFLTIVVASSFSVPNRAWAVRTGPAEPEPPPPAEAPEPDANAEPDADAEPEPVAEQEDDASPPTPAPSPTEETSPAEPTDAADDAAAPQTTGPSTEQRARALQVRARRRDKADNTDRLLVAGGAAMVGLGALAIVPMAVGLKGHFDAEQALDRLDTPSEASQRDRVETYQRRMTGLAIGAGIAAGAYVVTGLVLIGLGTTGRRRHATQVAPTVGRGSAGLTWQGRF